MKKKKSRVVEIVLNYKNEIIYFRSMVKGFPYIASVLSGKVTMNNWDFGASVDVLEAINAIEKVAARYGFKRMVTYIDHSSPDCELIENYIAERDGVPVWHDRRFTQYEWIIKI